MSNRLALKVALAGAIMVAVAAAATAAAQTVGSSGRKAVKATLILDFVPNAVHAGIYHAIAAGYYQQNGIDLKVIAPTSTADTLKLIDAGKADFGIADGIDVANQIDLGRDAKGIMALAQRPLGGPIALAKEHLRTAKDLEGKRVGLTGVPSDTATLETVVKHAGGDPKKVKTVVIGFNGVPNLENGKIAAFTGFWPADGVQLQVDGFPIKVFKLDENGGPAYPGLVVFSTQKRIRTEASVVRGFVAATVKGYQDTLRNPTRSLNELLRKNPSIKRKFAAASLKAYLPLFKADASRFGSIRASRIQQLSSWLESYKLIKKPISPARYATNAFLPKG
jgi:putative hydroxymethylpyrimidine transport system substrate-binding protein